MFQPRKEKTTMVLKQFRTILISFLWGWSYWKNPILRKLFLILIKISIARFRFNNYVWLVLKILVNWFMKLDSKYQWIKTYPFNWCRLNITNSIIYKSSNYMKIVYCEYHNEKHVHITYFGNNVEKDLFSLSCLKI